MGIMTNGGLTVERTVAAASIASRLLVAANHDGRSLTNLQLQKLVFLVQSKGLSERHAPTFREPVQAWKNGPVVKPLYGLYKEYHDQPIAHIDTSAISVEELREEVIDDVEDVWSLFGDMTGGALWALTHEPGRVWDKHYREGSLNIELPQPEIGSDWAAYRRVAELRKAGRLRASEHAAIEHPSLGTAQFATTSGPAYEAAKSRFRLSRPVRRAN
ncbi:MULTISPECIES: Panacea domain-containing protein [Frigoribacterium]|jgi:uncharacterized phage-associated protein|uniref:Panacea domain-containing protein n=1 Tax=Frigoribacterium TaxID=96492 RepID=UPI0009E3C1D7|nr:MULTISPECIES: type II toxin-antitoxin system antitoxin SocA domain-containing protein [Frigoribacterium]MDY0945914.1 DUF4065 domain-containing protein [Frigoribacterium sp. CFBP9039]NII52170.1 putative phage-associated protein [Frigoribacterium endophyticum]